MNIYNDVSYLAGAIQQGPEHTLSSLCCSRLTPQWRRSIKQQNSMLKSYQEGWDRDKDMVQVPSHPDISSLLIALLESFLLCWYLLNSPRGKSQVPIIFEGVDGFLLSTDKST